MKEGMHMSDEPRIYLEDETVPVPDKGGWIDGETGPVLPTPPAPAMNPLVEQPAPQQQPPPPPAEPAKKK